jgi:predicted AAA+ superfamily ATPase
MTIVRLSYLDWLEQNKDQQIIKVISGIRRSGKSTLFALFIEKLKRSGVTDKQIITINFEDPANDELLHYKKLYDFINHQLKSQQKYYIFLDEIQQVSEYEKAVDGLFIKKNVDLYITGSNAYFMSGDLATLLSGRYIELQILPLSFKEFYNFKLGHSVNLTRIQLYNEYIKGTFPYLAYVSNDNQRFDYLQGIYSSVLLKDIVARNNLQDVAMLERIIKFLFKAIGSLISIRKIANTIVSSGIKVSHTTVDKYVKAICESLVMYKVPRFNIKANDLLKSGEKYYLTDTGLRALLLKDSFEDFGHILENIIYLELIRRGNYAYVGSLKDGSEVDFICVKQGGEREYYQVAVTALDVTTLTREIRPLERIQDNYPKYLLTLDEYMPTANFDGIKKINALDWLLGKSIDFSKQKNV